MEEQKEKESENWKSAVFQVIEKTDEGLLLPL